MITTKTANEIVARTKRMEDAEYCLAHIKEIVLSHLELTLLEDVLMPDDMKKSLRSTKGICIDVKLLEIFLANIRDYEKIRLDELNYLAVQEAQDQIAEAQE